MTTEFIKVSRSDGIGIITLNRPDKRNAMHGPMIVELLRALKKFANDDSRLLLLHGEGEHFCAGGDIAWMQKIALGSDDENYDDAQSLADLLYHLYTFPKPSLVLAHGMTLGGGMGLLAAADIAVASRSASFGLPEVRIGLTPSMISPYVIAAIGERAAHYYFLTGERFGAEEAFRVGLIHQLSEADALMSTGMSLAQTLLMNSPQALRSAKQLIRRVSKQTISEDLAQKTAEHLAELRTTAEAQEGLHAFLEKRPPKWQ
ncbi:Hydroxycinnamoyl-CoA hydratase-lyase [Aquicella siphonis]|uniref:Hydroxycinnamoyl-CoA hydratase-lyase n=1 Tax=Aquicella siphonis TaxID=254247 RepID=A0A5E4PM68_9COXI|nr:enoyl-CoA hydratase-related protein [Aquicella siphonis]VVC77306.1 Hydroxycinnamoyl-CoA hydratase-lyase [Aquicella siphonis]